MHIFTIVCALALTPRYYEDPRIHNLGNVGMRGVIHAALAPLSTRIIDELAYSGTDLRSQILDTFVPAGARTVDLCCGVGYSTKHVGVDTSLQMLGVARLLHGGTRRFEQGNAETWRPHSTSPGFDVATCMFSMHEMPRGARRRVLRNLLSVAPKAIVVDISPDEYTPSPTMLWGEPYILEYQRNIDNDVLAVAHARRADVNRTVVVPGHAVMWQLDASE